MSPAITSSTGLGFRTRLATLMRGATELGIHFLENRSIVIGGVRFLGATLWTDYTIYAANEEEVGRAMAVARRGMSDYRYIRFGPKKKKGRDRILPGHLLEMHRVSVAWLSAQLAIPFEGCTVVITHHAPERRSVPPYFHEDEYTPCYASQTDLVRTPVKLWIHGHMHNSIDYELGTTRVLANPRGYAPPDDNPGFDPEFMVEV